MALRSSQALLCVSAIAFTFTPASAQNNGTREYNIGGGNLKAALDGYARQSNRQLIYRTDDVLDASSNGVRGRMSDDAALDALLPAGFKAQRGPSDVIAIVADQRPSLRPEADEIVVTAERRSTGVQKLANSISVRSGEDLRKQGRFSLRSIVEDIPGISGGALERPTGSNASGSDTMAGGLIIRGVPTNGSTAESIASMASASAIYVDGVYEGVGSSYDIAQVEALRGPQGTLYGRSATSGLVSIRTRNPDLADLGGNANAEVGNYGLRRYGGAINAPIINDVLALRVSGNRYERDGYYAKVGGAVSSTDLRAKLLYRPSENLSILLGAALQDNVTHSGGVNITQSAPNVLLFDRSGDSATTAPGSNKFRQYWGEVTWDLGGVTLTYQPALRSWTSDTVLINRGGPAPADLRAQTPTDNFYTHELRLLSNSGSALKWQVGAFYYRNNLETHSQAYRVLIPNPTALPSGFPDGATISKSDMSRKTTNAALFGEGTYSFDDTTRLTAGLRYDYTKVRTEQFYFSGYTNTTLSLGGAAGEREFNNSTYRVRIEHDLSPANLVYASTSSGFSPGDIAIGSGLSGLPEVLELKDQTLTSYEIGSKNRFLNNKLQVNATAYYIDYGGFQTAMVSLGAVFSPLIGSAASQFAVLRSPIQVHGAELEVFYNLTARDRLGLDLAYTRSRFVDKKTYPIAGTDLTFDDFYARDQVPGVIPVKANINYTHTFELSRQSTLSIRGDVRYLSKHDEGALAQDQLAAGFLPYVVANDQVVGNISATLVVNDRFSLTGYIRNVGNSRNKFNTRIFTVAAPPPLGIFRVNTAEVSDPRTFGLVANVTF